MVNLLKNSVPRTDNMANFSNKTYMTTVCASIIHRDIQDFCQNVKLL